jgi:hypothetical protein
VRVCLQETAPLHRSSGPVKGYADDTGALWEKGWPGRARARLFLVTKEFEGPNGPPRDERNEVCVTHNNAAFIFGNPQLKMDVVAQQARSAKRPTGDFRGLNARVGRVAPQ